MIRPLTERECMQNFIIKLGMESLVNGEVKSYFDGVKLANVGEDPEKTFLQILKEIRRMDYCGLVGCYHHDQENFKKHYKSGGSPE